MFWRRAPTGNVAEPEHDYLRDALLERWRCRQRLTLSDAFVHPAGRRSISHCEMLEDRRRIPFTYGMLAQLRFGQALDGLGNRVVNLLRHGMHACRLFYLLGTCCFSRFSRVAASKLHQDERV